VLLMLGAFHNQLLAQGATCATATSLTCPQTVSGSTVGLTAQAVPTCITTLNTAGGHWYTTQGTGGNVNITTCNAGSNYDTKLGVFSGTCGALVCVTGNDDAACAFSGLRSTVNFNSVAGTTYFIYVTGFSTGTGAYQMSITGACGPAGPPPPPPPPPGPANDLCANRASISCGGSVAGTTVNATVDNAGTCVTTNTAPGVWYSFMGNNSIVTLNTCGSGYDSKLSVYTGSCGTFTCVTGNDDFCSLQSQVTFFAATGTEYFVLVHGFSSATGAFTLNATCVTCPFPVQAPWTATAINGSVMTSQVECNGSITASGTGVGSTTADRLSFIHQTLSGNGYITAKINSFTNWAYGGVQFREGLTAGALKVGVSTQLGSRSTIEARSTLNAAHTIRNVAAPKHSWVRLARNGNVFTSYVSDNGTTWTQVDQRTVTMASSLSVGIYVYSQLASSGTVNFSNVTVSTGVPLNNDNISSRTQESEINVPLVIFPNPVASDLNIKMGSLMGEKVEFTIYNMLGQVVFNQEVQEAVEVERLNVNQLKTGVYMIQVNENTPVKFVVDK
jgi:hypothetical protein